MNNSKIHLMTNRTFLPLYRLISVIIFSLSFSFGQIYNIDEFLEKCPTNDPAYNQIRADFEIRRNGIPVGEITCNEPISNIPIADYTDELIILQGLRTIYYMDRNMSNHLPWTNKSLYDWLKSKVDGFNIKDGVSGGYFSYIDGKPFIIFGPKDDFDRNFSRTWRGLSGKIAFYGHEARHRDGYYHVSCCGTTSGCDQTYDETNLGAYGIQYWLFKAWLNGIINVGINCLSNSRVQQIAEWHIIQADANITRYCDNPPPKLTMPGTPGGECPDLTTIPPATPNNFIATVGEGMVVLSWNANTEPDLESYNIYRGIVDGGWKDYLANVDKLNTSYTDVNIDANTTYFYQIDAKDNSGNLSNRSNQISTTTLNILNNNLIKGFLLKQNTPNPFNPVTEIEFSIPINTEVNIVIYDLMGNEIKTLIKEYKQSGQYKVNWAGNDDSGQSVSGGVYFYKIQAGDFIQTRKMVLLK